MAKKLKNNFNEEITLTEEQAGCLKYNGDKMLMVKGVAGSGKSLIIQAKAKQMIEQYSNGEKGKVVIFTYNKTLSHATKEFLELNGNATDAVEVTTIQSYLYQLCKSMNAPCYKVLHDPLYTEKKVECIVDAIEEHRRKHGHHRLQSMEPEFLISEFDWMKKMNVAEDDFDYYMSIPRKGRGSKLRMNATDRKAAYQLFEIYIRLRKVRHLSDWDDFALHVTHHPDKIPANAKFDHILIDEAQDLSLAQMLAATCLFNKDMVVAMDINQRIYDQQWTTKQLGIESTTKKLTKSMRTTKQIDTLAESVRSNNDDELEEDDKTIRVVPEREGPIPQIVKLDNIDSEVKYIVEQIKAWLEQSDKVSIGIIVSKKKQLDIVGSWMTDAGIEHEIIKQDAEFSMSKPGVKIVNVFNTKGLEFTRVIIPMFIEGNYPYRYKETDDELMQKFIGKSRNLVYVAMTRAQYSLTITYNDLYGTKSRFLSEMKSDCYEAIGFDKPSGEIGKKIKRKQAVVVADNSASTDLKSYLENRGLEVVDKRKSGGRLWVVGDSEAIGDVISEVGSKYGAFGSYAKGSAIGNRVGWWTKYSK